MLSINHANTCHLPTTAAPAPEKGYPKRFNAQRTATRIIGPHAREGFEFETFKCDGLWFWREFAEAKPLSAAQLKANGGNKAMLAAAVNEPAKTAPVVDPHAFDIEPDAFDIPPELKRDPPTAEERKALIAKAKRTTGPTRIIKNPPNVKAAKARAEKTKAQGVGFVARSAILAGKTNAEALAEVMAAFPKCGSNNGCMGWYRNKLRKEGLLKKDNTPTVKAAGAPEVMAVRSTKRKA